MAAKMIHNRDLKDDFLSELIRSNGHEPVPAGLAGSVMDKVMELDKRKASAAMAVPVWIRWGVPLSGLACLLVLMILPESGIPDSWLKGFSNMEAWLESGWLWLTGLLNGIRLPVVSLPENLVWYILSGLGLFWAFALLNHYLSKHLSP